MREGSSARRSSKRNSNDSSSRNETARHRIGTGNGAWSVSKRSGKRSPSVAPRLSDSPETD